MPRSLLSLAIALGLVLIAGSCGGDDSADGDGDAADSVATSTDVQSTDAPSADSEEAAEDAVDEAPDDEGIVPCAATIVLDTAADTEPVFGREDTTGSVELTLLEIRVLPSTYPDPFVGGEISTDAAFVGVRYEVASEASRDFQPAVSVGNKMLLTDGSQFWSNVDYRNGIGNASGAWAVSVGDEQPATMVAPGFRNTTWVVFEVPAGASPDAVTLPLYAAGVDACLSLEREELNT